MSKDFHKEQQAYPELKAVLDHQERLAARSQAVKSIDAAIDEQQQKLTAAREGRPSPDGLAQRRQDLLAAEALGQVSEAERQAQEHEIDREVAQLKERFASVDQSISRGEAALSGLRKQREKANEQLQALRSQANAVLAPFIVAEAEKACVEYVNAALVVKERYLHLLSLSDILTPIGEDLQPRPNRLRGLDAGRFFIPSFNLPQCMGIVHPKLPGRLVSAEQLDYSGEQEAEIARLHALGVTLI